MYEHTGTLPHWKPWFESLNNAEAIRQKATVHVSQIPRSQLEQPVVALELFWKAWKRIYLPDDPLVGVLSQHVDRAHLFAQQRYPSVLKTNSARYSAQPAGQPDPGDILLWLLTGLAGTGKSSTMSALVRLLAPPVSSATSLPGVLIQARPVLHIKLRSAITASALFRSLANPLFTAGRTNIKPEELRSNVWQWLHAQSVLLIVLDELQFLSRSDGASVNVANLIAEFLELGIPLSYVCNYSLGHKLKARHQEDTDRLLLHPDLVGTPSDEHWAKVVAEFLNVCPELFEIDAKLHAAEFGRLTAKLYRLLGTLLSEACRLAWANGIIRPVTMADVRAAVGSRGYARPRETVEDLKLLPFSVAVRKRRRDLVCPFEDLTSALPADRSSSSKETKHPAQSPAAVHQYESAIHAPGRQLLRDLNRPAANSGEGESKGTSVSRQRRKGPVTAEDLLAGAKRLSEGLKPKPASPQTPEPDAD